jgi:phosphate transport system substrate-binding protein
MKKLLVVAPVCAWVVGAGLVCCGAEELKGSISISGAWALYPMTVKWAEEFKKVNPGVKIDIAAGGAGKGMADALGGIVDIGMVSRAVNPAEAKKGAWWVAVTKDAVVPAISEGNPAAKDLLARGVTRDALIGVWITGKVKEWGALAGRDVKEPIHVYTRSDACGAAQVWAEFLGKKQEDLLGVGVYGDPGLAEAVRKDALGIGFNNIGYAYDAKSKAPVKGIRILPLDLDGNGRLDQKEDFYATKDAIVKAINDGVYPSPPARELNFVCKSRPEKEPLKAFVKWVLTDGQKFVAEAGYINLPAEKLAGELSKLEGK